MPSSWVRGPAAHRPHSRAAATTFVGAVLCAVASVKVHAAPVYETVVVAEGEVARARDDRAASATVITSERTPRAGEDLPQVLSEAPGIDVIRYGGAGAHSTVSLRGSTPNQVQVYVDDVPLNVATGGGVDLGFLPLAQVSRIEIYRGSSPMQFGASGIGGVLSLRTHVPDEDAVYVRSTVGSFEARGLGGGFSGRASGLRFLAAAQAFTWNGAYGFLNDNGTTFNPSDDVASQRQNNDLTQVDGNVKLEVPWGHRLFTGSLMVNRREQGVPGFALHQATETRLRTNRVLAQLSLDSRGDLGAGSRLRANAYAVATDQFLRDPYAEIFPAPVDSRDHYRTFGGAVRAQWLFGSVGFRTLLEATQQSFLSHDAEKRDPAGAPGSRLSATAGAEADVWWRWAQLAVLPSLRLEVARDVISTRQRFTDTPQALAPELYLLPVARLGFVQDVGQGLKVHANVGRYVRLPSTTERYGNTGFILPNPELAPERGINTDLGLRGEARSERGAPLAFESSVFANWASDLIQYVSNGQGQARANNINSARIVGVELAAQLHVRRWVRVLCQGTYTHAINLSEDPAHAGRRLPLRWPWRFYLRPELRELTLSKRVKAGFYGDVSYASGGYRDPNNALPIPTRWLFGAGLNVRHDGLGVTLTASAYNLADVRAMDEVGFPLPGRSVFLSLAWNLNVSTEINPS